MEAYKKSWNLPGGASSFRTVKRMRGPSQKKILPKTQEKQKNPLICETISLCTTDLVPRFRPGSPSNSPYRIRTRLENKAYGEGHFRKGRLRYINEHFFTVEGRVCHQLIKASIH